MKKFDTLYGRHDITSLKALSALSEKFISKLSSKEIILLEGELGAGKSEWVRQCLKNSGWPDKAGSPSFSIHHTYKIKDRTIDHLDLYRITDDSELESIGFFDLFLKKQAWIFIEWGGRLCRDILPVEWNKTHLHFSFKNNKRSLRITSF